jgi:serine/threonine-protein kinase
VSTPPAAASLAAGTTLGRYRVERALAEGGMAEVYEATHLDLMKRVALKILHTSFADEPTIVQRFVNEARAASRLQHPHILGVSDFGVERGRPYMVLDYLEGEDLSRTLARHGKLPLPRLVDLVLPVVSAIGAAHAEGILHRDLKPENVFIAKRHGREYPILLDFGVAAAIARSAKARALTRENESVGTPFYMSPEHVTGSRDLDGRTDQYAVAVLLYQCATGVLPYEAPSLQKLLFEIVSGKAEPPSKRGAEIPPELDAIIMRAMTVAREDRFESMRELGRALWPFASPVTQAIWVEEFGDPEVVAARMSPLPQRAHPVVPETGEHATKGALRPVRAEDLGPFEAFEQLPAAAVASFLTKARGRTVPAGAAIVRQGARGHGCYLLLSGEVEVVKTTASGSWTLGRLTPGSIFGQISLVDHVPRTASVVGVGEVHLLEVDRETFEQMLLDTDAVAQALREQVARSGIRQLRRATKRLAALLQQRTSGGGRDARRELVYLQAAAQEWALPIDEDDGIR